MANESKGGKTTKRASGLTDEELAAMKETLQERRSGNSDWEGAVLAKIATMPEPDRSMARRLHAIIRAAAPGLTPRTWYGMPAYSKGDDVLCWFQPASKFKARYALIGFSDKARLDEGLMWPISYALNKLTAAEEARIAALVRKAVG